jgi:hypothetical protein
LAAKWYANTTRIMERGWFPRTAPPAGGLRAVPDPGLIATGLLRPGSVKIIHSAFVPQRVTC